MLYICNQKYNNCMQTATVKVQTAFRLDSELLRRLKVLAKRENRSLNNYVETVLMDVAYDEPNSETLEALNEVRGGGQLQKLDVDNLEEFVEAL